MLIWWTIRWASVVSSENELDCEGVRGMEWVGEYQVFMIMIKVLTQVNYNVLLKVQACIHLYKRLGQCLAME